MEHHCIDPCSPAADPPCARNALCFSQNHAAICICPPHLPNGNPLAYCEPPPVFEKPECELDVDCPSKLACIKNKCVNPCLELSPCPKTSSCSVLDTVPVRTMICTCPEGWVPNALGECTPILVQIPPGCTSDDDCPSNEACVNRLCRNPCNCGPHSKCLVQNHRPICSCEQGFEGNPNVACYTVGCRTDSECGPAKACINNNCVNPCLVKDSCGINAECFVHRNQAQCRCRSGYRGDPFTRCTIVGCVSNSDCPNDRQCINAQCINPCIYSNPCSSLSECRVQNHIALCRCPLGFIGNPYVSCRKEPEPECRQDTDCPGRLACINEKCQNPCTVLQPCHNPAECLVSPTVPVRTMICVCPIGYISSGSGTCNPLPPLQGVACLSDTDCPNDRSCVNNICKNPCSCGPNADCRVKNHKPICTCKQGFNGNPDLECTRIGCTNNDECSEQHTCINRQCVPACAADDSPCGTKATCYATNHRAVCECPPGFIGNPKISCGIVGCRSNSDCPTNRACINDKCENPCTQSNPCDDTAECKVYNHEPVCACPPGYIGNTKTGCKQIEEKCSLDKDCPSQLACIAAECINPCEATKPCGVNAICKVFDTEPVRTMVCECPPGYQGNAAVQCDKSNVVPTNYKPVINLTRFLVSPCREDLGFIRGPDGKCICPPGKALNDNNECVYCPIEEGFKIDENGRCKCALERGMIIDDRGKCICPTEFGYRLDVNGNCTLIVGPECETDDECPDNKYCNLEVKKCDNPCIKKECGKNAFCNATHHQAICVCLATYTGNPDVECSKIESETFQLTINYKKIILSFSSTSFNAQSRCHTC